MSEDNIVKGDAPAYMSNKEIHSQIAVLQQPGSAYWDKNHPSHSEAVAEVQSLIQKKSCKKWKTFEKTMCKKNENVEEKEKFSKKKIKNW